MKETKLLNCPFCDGEHIVESLIEFVPCLKCLGCGAIMKIPMDFKGNYKKELIRKWNTRKPMERILERLETEDMALFNAINKYQKKMYTDDDALDRVRMLQHKQLSNHKAIEIVKEEGGIE